MRDDGDRERGRAAPVEVVDQLEDRDRGHGGLGVNRKMTTDSVVMARTKAVTRPVVNGPRRSGNSTSRKARRLPAPRLVAASSIERSICCRPATAAR